MSDDMSLATAPELSDVRKPDFFLVGAAKAGTTSLFYYLIQHPLIFIPPVKEPHYFSEFPQPRAPTFRTVEDYLRLFRGCDEKVKAGDASTSYLYSRHAADRIHALQPRARILIILRNPIDRAYSFFWHNKREFVEPLDFEAALAAEPQRISDDAPFRFHYFTSGLYHDQVKAYLDVFGREQVMVCLFEDLTEDAESLCHAIFSFLEVSSVIPVKTQKRFNPSGLPRSRLLGHVLAPQFPGRRAVRFLFPQFSRRLKYHLMRWTLKDPPPMDPGTRSRLAERFGEDVRRLGHLIDRDLSHWVAPARRSGS